MPTYKMNTRIRNSIYVISIILLLGSCQKYLDKKPDETLDIPTTIASANALLNNFAVTNRSYPYLALIAADDYYNPEAVLGSMSEESRAWYLWQPIQGNLTNNTWRNVYGKILNYNIAIETLRGITPAGGEESLYNECWGMAHFCRGFTFFIIAQLYADVYDPANASQTPGIPVRLGTDINERISRGTLQQSYDQIVKDLQTAIDYLPENRTAPHRPTKAAAQTLLAYIMLHMGNNKTAAELTADALSFSPALIDFNTLNPNANAPFTLFNQEVLFHATSTGATNLAANNWKADTLLYGSYQPNDLRKVIFFRSNPGGGFQFSGSLDGTVGSAPFCGISLSETYLVRAEALAKLNMKDQAMNTLNQLLVNRWKTGTYQPLTALDANDALQQIIMERRKELVGRGIRWYDLRRITKEQGVKITLKRRYAGMDYLLEVPGPRVMFQIPNEVIAASGMVQNPE